MRRQANQRNPKRASERATNATAYSSHLPAKRGASRDRHGLSGRTTCWNRRDRSSPRRFGLARLRVLRFDAICIRASQIAESDRKQLIPVVDLNDGRRQNRGEESRQKEEDHRRRQGRRQRSCRQRRPRRGLLRFVVQAAPRRSNSARYRVLSCRAEIMGGTTARWRLRIWWRRRCPSN